MQRVSNEPVLEYRQKSSERRAIEQAIASHLADVTDIPMRINGCPVRSDDVVSCIRPDMRSHTLGEFHSASSDHVSMAIDSALEARAGWASMSLDERARIFLKAADLLAGPFRQILNGATMLGQGKTVYQAEIDSACELIDFLRFNVAFAYEIEKIQPVSERGILNRSEYRGMEGFVFAVSPFNFTAIAGNLAIAPALMGNTVVWKPSERSVYSAHFLMDLFEAAGIPPGVINMIPSHQTKPIGDMVFSHPEFSGLHFTGSTTVFRQMWSQIGNNISRYKNYPRIVGETGGKDFVFLHPSANPRNAAIALIRGAFEYQGQKCSAASRAYIPASLYDEVMGIVEAEMQSLSMGPVTEFGNFMSAVIDERAYRSITAYQEFSENDGGHQVLIGGGASDEEGFFVEPTVVLASDIDSKLMTEEIFGPILTVYRYEDAQMEDVLEAVDKSTQYALTGGIFAQDRAAIHQLSERLKYAAGNFYVNDKPTGAVVGQQPFGGARASGTNDKAGSLLNLLRWTSPRTVKENFVPPLDYKYPHMA